MMSGAFSPDFDAYGLFCATHFHNPTQYIHGCLCAVQAVCEGEITYDFGRTKEKREHYG